MFHTANKKTKIQNMDRRFLKKILTQNVYLNDDFGCALGQTERTRHLQRD